MFALPSYFLNDIQVLEEKLNALTFPTDFLVPELSVIKVYWDGDPGFPAGEFRVNERTGKYTFYVNEDTLAGLTQGES